MLKVEMMENQIVIRGSSNTTRSTGNTTMRMDFSWT